MKKISVLFCLFILSFTPVFSQTQAEIDKMIKDALEKIEKMKNDPKYKDLLKDMPPLNPITTIKEKEPAGITKPVTLKPYIRKLPVRNDKLLSAIPGKPFTKTELIASCNDLFKQLAGKISPAKVKAVNDMMAKPGGNGYKFSLAAVASWYNGAAEEAILMASKAAMQYPDDDVLLNNLSAMLNLGGLEQKAIPILKTLLQKYPDNPMVLNNMGQAYAGLGDQETAMLFFGLCIAKSPNHPEANNTAGQIELAKGNKEKAKEHFEQSLKGTYNSEASGALRYIDPPGKIFKVYPAESTYPRIFQLL